VEHREDIASPIRKDAVRNDGLGVERFLEQIEHPEHRQAQVDSCRAVDGTAPRTGKGLAGAPVLAIDHLA
jgi:hypothetical protein